MATGTGSLLRRSLAHDDADRYTGTWAVLCLSLLALVFLLVPFGGSSAASTASETGSSSKLVPEVEAVCWCPAQFEESQVRYANTYCTDAANSMFKGVNITDRFVHHQGHITVEAPSVLRMPPNSSTTYELLNQYNEGLKKHEERSTRKYNIGNKMKELVSFKFPVSLFLLALCLKLPHILWSLFKGMQRNCIDVDQILVSCVASRSMDVEKQKEVHNLATMAVAESTKRSRNSASYLYIFLKVSTFLIVLAEIIFVTQYIMTDIQAIEKDLEIETPLSKKTETSAEADISDDLDSLIERLYFTFPNNLYHCFFTIKMLVNVHDYTVQCMLIRKTKSESVANDASDVTNQATTLTNQSTLLLYKALFTIVLSLLVTLAVVNFFNTITWLRKLTVSSYATSMGLPSNAAKDVVLLVHMAWLNAGPVVARGLTGSSAWSGGLEEINSQPVADYKA